MLLLRPAAVGLLLRWGLLGDFHLHVGLCGGLSTFSTFSNETLGMMEGGHLAGALVNIALNVIVCLVAVWVGMRLGTSIATA